MKVLFDENIADKLRWHLPGHEVETTKHRGWQTFKNGRLLAEAEAAGFEVFLTADRNLSYQQNLSGRKLALVVLNRNSWKLLQTHAKEIANALDQSAPGSFITVNCDS